MTKLVACAERKRDRLKRALHESNEKLASKLHQLKLRLSREDKNNFAKVLTTRYSTHTINDDQFNTKPGDFEQSSVLFRDKKPKKRMLHWFLDFKTRTNNGVLSNDKATVNGNLKAQVYDAVMYDGTLVIENQSNPIPQFVEPIPWDISMKRETITNCDPASIVESSSIYSQRDVYLTEKSLLSVGRLSACIGKPHTFSGFLTTADRSISDVLQTNDEHILPTNITITEEEWLANIRCSNSDPLITSSFISELKENTHMLKTVNCNSHRPVLKDIIHDSETYSKYSTNSNDYQISMTNIQLEKDNNNRLLDY
ncbi:uncharacterized protein KLLA0_A08690g [Kluyveromyces lactis]|uniref:KLLA0A08690p n=1 Tax=Kluyveromyces lactis (strain ATCC 8585 / CBS 2359 / DSM 70799 / NBRC 1267 / NRRL Y-1140 / WM37) TaxID=284590 RepID=Q6CXF8_KLULA|nr:uncharacterized protein KLLA0_A08690g [Kluyveromyces lactis]CAH02969.1 KLLA0A08690p [Kluyveromyces lactis]|eukprot:XP_451381.1 uncharacterized protein KLLA0_A08690g [Kluyveromyces lactis]